MSNQEAREEEAYFHYMEARQASIQGAIGYFITDQVPSEMLHIIATTTTNEAIKLAAEIVLWETRKEEPGLLD